MSVAELKAMSQRLAVAKMLKQDLTYTEIAASTELVRLQLAV